MTSSIHFELTSMVKEDGDYTSTRRPSLLVGSYASSLPFYPLNYLRYTNNRLRTTVILLIALSVFFSTSKLFQNIVLAPITSQSIVLTQLTFPKNVIVAHDVTKRSCGSYRSSKTLFWHTSFPPELFWRTLHTHMLFWRTPFSKMSAE